MVKNTTMIVENTSTGLYLPEAKMATVAPLTAIAIMRSVCSPDNHPNSATTFPTPPTIPPN